MNLDAPTLLAAAMLTTGLMAGAHLVVWMQDRRETAILWMVAATVLGCAGAILRDVLPETPAILLANVAVLLGLASVATACRTLAGRRFALVGLAGAPCLWLVACAVPAFLGDQGLRVIVASAASAALMGWAVAELWCDRREWLAARIGLVAVLSVHGLASLLRVLTAILAYDGARTGLVKSANLTFVTLWALGFVLLTGFGVILIIKERAERRLRHEANQDGLTGLPNRRRFDAVLEESFVGAARRGRPLTLLMIDVDAFKAYNDLYGHPEGDRLLQVVAAALAAAAGEAGGFAARYGGEEFALLLPDVEAATALTVADAVRRGVRQLAVPHSGSEHGCLTISIGLATMTPEAGAAAWDLLRAADQALYAAKRSGRDSIRGEACVRAAA